VMWRAKLQASLHLNYLPGPVEMILSVLRCPRWQRAVHSSYNSCHCRRQFH